MAKCIKSITAGLLHLEVLGKVPMETWRAIGSALDRLDPEG